MENLDRLLRKIEDQLDLDHIRFVESLYRDALHYRPVPCLPLSILAPVPSPWKLFAYSEAFEDPEKMLGNELFLKNLSNAYWGISGIQSKNSISLKCNGFMKVAIKADYFPGHTILTELARIQSTDVIIPLIDGRQVRLRCVVRPD